MENDMLRDMKQAHFRNNNAAVLRALNLLRIRYERLSDVKYALNNIEEQEFLDSVNYLHEAGYVQLRRSRTKEKALLADWDYTELEGKLTHKGIKILNGDEIDNSIGVI
ncbi:MAG: type VI secretion protein [Acutalibacteraceae bacterium]